MNCGASSPSRSCMIRTSAGHTSHRVSRVFLWCRVVLISFWDEITNAHAIATVRDRLARIAIALIEQVLFD